MEIDFSKLFGGITVNINVNITDDAVKMLNSLLGNAATKITVNNQSNTTAAEAPKAEATHVAEVAHEEAPTQEAPSQEATVQEEVKTFDIKAVAKAIREYVALAQSGEDLNETSAIMTDEILKMTNGLVHVRLGAIGRCHNISTNFYGTKAIADIKGKKWSGWIRTTDIEPTLEQAFADMSAFVVHGEGDEFFPLSGKYSKCHKTFTQPKGSYTRVPAGSKLLRMRCHKNSDEMAPMIIDPEIARELFNESYTHVKIGATGKRIDGRLNSDSINLIFQKERVQTRAPKKSETISRLRPYGSHNGVPTTYAIGGDAFQKSILRHFGETCQGMKECLFKIERTGNVTDKGIGYKITKA